jgi:cytochrome c553
MDGTIPILAGQQRRYLEKQLELFRAGARVDPAMQVVTAHASVGDQHDILELTSYLSSLDSNPKPVTGSGEHLRVGQEIYAHICAACHGADGRGEAGNRVPGIAGQQDALADYISRLGNSDVLLDSSRPIAERR